MPGSPLTWRVLLRRGWIALLAVALGAGAASAVGRVSVSASSAFRVIANGGHASPYQASRLARSYAQLLPEDPAVLWAVGRASGHSARYVHAHMTMSARVGTAVVFARYSADDAPAALAGLRALQRSFATALDGAGSPLRATVAPLADPGLARGFSRSRALVLGALGGLLAALALILTLERRSPRVDDLRDLAALVPLPVSRVSERALPDALAALRGAGGPPRRALAFRRGTPAIDVEQAWRASAGSGLPIGVVLLVERSGPLTRLRGARHGVRAA